MNDRLGVGLRSKGMPRPFQPMPELLVVIDLAIEDDLNGAIFVAKRLMPCILIDDR